MIITDWDDTMLTAAEVAITSNYTASEDVLAYAEIAGISATYDAPSGTLNLSGEALIDAYQTILQSVTYENTEPIANRLPRILTFTVSDGDLTSNNFEIEINIQEVEDPVVIYQLVTPDGDGLNDTWIIDGILQFPNNSVKLFDRWNSLVFEVNGYNNDQNAWLGQSNTGFSKGELPDGTYFYTIDLNNGTNLRKGFIVLKRK